MCGIAGVLGNIPERVEKIGKMLHVQRHRGPDHTGMYDLGIFGILGHNRLSIIDRDAAANQPFHSEDGRFAIVFNGEIYNYLELKEELLRYYAFRTASDTEVLLNAWRHWGKNCLERFLGMFAFAIWDEQEKILFAARDRFGVKPFHYSLHNDNFFFASEIKALWAAGIPKIPNEPVWANYLTFGAYGMPDETFWEDIRQLPGGHYLEWKNGQLTIHRWYNFVERVHLLPSLNENEVIEQWTNLALESIRLRFRSDVPVGFNLSGGLDSSLLLALAHRQFPENRQIEAFTFYTGDDRYDELPWVQEMILLTNFPLNPVKLNVEEVPELASQVSWFEDEPYGGVPTLAYSKIFQKAREKGIIVLLDGQGMDEAWAGYDYCLNRSGNLVQGSASSPVRPECLQPDFRQKAVQPDFPKPFDNDLQNLQYRDLFYTKIPRALRFNDRISMMHSTELREPFLDHRLIELAFSLPMEMKIRNGQQKWLARKVAENYLPGKITLAPKRPLQTPQREWLAGILLNWVQNQIDIAASLPFFDDNAVQQTWNAYRQGDNENSFFVWQWISAAQMVGVNSVALKNDT